MRYPLVLITWKDHCTASDRWIDTKHLDDHCGLEVCFSVGFLVKETHESYSICTTCDEADEELGGIWTIGKGMVVSKEVLQEGSDGRKQAD